MESVAADSKDIKRFQSDGELYDNNWENGDADYRQRIRDVLAKMGADDTRRWAGRSDIFEWIDRDLAPRVAAVNADFARRYGWDTAGSADIQRSPARATGLAQGADGTDDTTAARGAVRQADVDPLLKERRDFTGRPGSKAYEPVQAK